MVNWVARASHAGGRSRPTRMGGAPSEPGRRLGVGCAVERCEPIEHAGGRTMMRKMPIRPWPMLSCALLMVSAGSFAPGKPAVHVDAEIGRAHVTITITNANIVC